MNNSKLKSVIGEIASQAFRTEFDILVKDFRKNLRVMYCAGTITIYDLPNDDNLQSHDVTDMILKWISETEAEDYLALEELLPEYKKVVEAAERRLKQFNK